METWSIKNPPQGTMGVPTIEFDGITRSYLDISYAHQSPNQKLDILLPPEGNGPFPTVIFVHGGAFLFGAKRDTQFLHAIDGINRGYAVVTVEYRQAFEAKYPAGLFDVKAAIRYLRANAVLYKLDPNRFTSCGDSAGAYYTVLAAATDGNPAFEDMSMGNPGVSSGVKAVVSWYGVFDMLAHRGEQPPAEAPDPKMPDIEKLLFGAPSKDIEGLMHFTNPLHFITRDFPPIFITAGSADKVVSVSQSYMLRDKLAAVCPPDRYEFEILEGFNHGGIDPRWYEKKYADRAYAFFDKYLR